MLDDAVVARPNESAFDTTDPLDRPPQHWAKLVKSRASA